MGITDYLLDPIGKLIDNSGGNKYLKAIHGLTDPIASGTYNIKKGYNKGGWRGAIGGLSDTAAYGVGDFISPFYTDEEGDNPIYDRVGPIMAGYWGGPIFGGIADEYAKGSKYNEVGKYHLGALVGGGSAFESGSLFGQGEGIGDLFSSGGNWFVDFFKGVLGGGEVAEPASAAAGPAGEGGASTLSPVGEAPMWQKFLNNDMFKQLLGSNLPSGSYQQTPQPTVSRGSSSSFGTLSENLANMKLRSIKSGSELNKINTINPFS